MGMIIEIPDSLAEILRTRAQISGESVDTFTNAWLTDTLAADESEAVQGIREGLEDATLGREEPLANSLAGMLGFLDKHAADSDIANTV